MRLHGGGCSVARLTNDLPAICCTAGCVVCSLVSLGPLFLFAVAGSWPGGNVQREGLTALFMTNKGGADATA